MKKGIIGLLVMTCALGACQKDAYDPNYNPDLGARVPDNFEWSTTKTLTVNVDVNDEYNGKYFYAVRIYDKAPTEGVLPVAASGKVNKNMPFSQKIVVPATISKLYIVQAFKKADASEVIIKKEAAINGENIAYSFGNSNGTRSAITRGNGNAEDIIIQNGKVLEINSTKDKFQHFVVKDGGTLHFATGGELDQWTINIEDGGKMTAAKETTLSLKNSELYNYGEVNIYDIEFSNGSILHNGDAMEGRNEGGCFYAHDIYMVNGHGNDKRYLGERSYTSCEKLILDNNKLTMKTSAWLNCDELFVPKGGASTLYGEGSTIGNTGYVALATIDKMNLTGKLTVEKNVLVECDNSDLKQNNIVEDASDMITIVGTSCNDGGFGNDEEAELGTYTYIIEDMYPTQGDYDMNDIVVSLTVTQEDDELEIKGELKAVGAVYQMIPYITVNGKTKPLLSKNNQALEAHAILTNSEVTSTPVNTIIGQPYYPAQPFEVEFDDVPNGLTIDDIDFHIIVDNTKIHWNTRSDNGTATWGMRIPGSDFKWPQEKVSITKAYTEFTKWFENKDYPWYNQYNSSLVYSHQ